MISLELFGIFWKALESNKIWRTFLPHFLQLYDNLPHLKEERMINDRCFSGPSVLLSGLSRFQFNLLMVSTRSSNSTEKLIFFLEVCRLKYEN